MAIPLSRARESIVVTDLSSLEELVTGPPWLWPRKILLNLAGLTGAETERWQGRLNAHYLACGCKAGTIMMAFTIELYVLLLSLSVENMARLSWLHFLGGGLLGLLGAVVGKILGMGWARYRLKRTVEQLALHLAKSNETI